MTAMTSIDEGRELAVDIVSRHLSGIGAELAASGFTVATGDARIFTSRLRSYAELARDRLHLRYLITPWSPRSGHAATPLPAHALLRRGWPSRNFRVTITITVAPSPAAKPVSTRRP